MAWNDFYYHPEQKQEDLMLNLKDIKGSSADPTSLSTCASKRTIAQGNVLCGMANISFLLLHIKHILLLLLIIKHFIALNKISRRKNWVLCKSKSVYAVTLALAWHGPHESWDISLTWGFVFLNGSSSFYSWVRMCYYASSCNSKCFLVY